MKIIKPSTWEIETAKRQVYVPAIGECESCEQKVILKEFTNPCSCGIDYNGFGQKLAPRSLWEYETGENPEECY